VIGNCRENLKTKEYDNL